VKKKVIAFFDFDGTVTKRDSLSHFIQYGVGHANFLLGLCALMPVLLAYKMNLIPNNRAKEKTISYFFKGWEFTRFLQIASHYSEYKLPQLIRNDILKKIDWHKALDHEVVIVTASLEHYLAGWCVTQKASLIGTRLEVQNGKITGRFASPNCYGTEKVKRIRESFSLSHYDYIYAYGDSRGDREMLGLANEKYYRGVRVP
jgi:phosphatidylglycerophosphatase C